MISLVLSALVSFQPQATKPDLKQLITYSQVGAPLSRALDDLNRMSGMAIRCDSTLREEVVAIRVNNVPLENVLKDISSAICAKFDPDSLKLLADIPTRTKQYETWRQTKVDEGSRAIDAYQALLKEAKPPTAAEIRKLGEDSEKYFETDDPSFDANFEQRINDLSPCSKLGSSILKSIGYAKIMEQAPFVRVVYATNPFPSQRPLDASILPLLNQLESSALEINRMMQEAGINEESSLHYIFDDGLSDSSRVQHVPIVRAYVIATVNPTMDPPVDLECIAKDAKGEDILQFDLGAALVLTTRDNHRSPDPKPTETPRILDVPAEAQSFAKLLWSRDVYSRPDAMPTAIDDPHALANLFNPSQIEPLSLIAGRRLLQVAEANQLDVIAKLSETNIFDGLEPEEKSYDASMKYFRDNPEYQVIRNAEPGSPMILGPKNPFVERLYPRGRNELQGAMKSAVTQGFISLHDMIPLSNLLVPTDLESIFIQYIRSASGSEDYELFDLVYSPQILRFISSLTPSQWNALKAGQPMGYGSLTAGQQAEFRNWMYNCEDLSFTVEGSEATGEEDIEPTIERTDILTNGVPAGTTLTVASDVVQSLACYDEQGHLILVAQPESLGARFGMMALPNFMQLAKRYQAIKKFRLVAETSLMIDVKISPTISTQVELSDAVLDPSTGFMTRDQLPPAIRSAIDRAEKAVRDSGGRYDGPLDGGPGEGPPNPGS